MPSMSAKLDSRPGRVAAVLLLGSVLAACGSTPATRHDALTAGAEPLRSRFNRDIGHTRLVLLAAPT